MKQAYNAMVLTGKVITKCENCEKALRGTCRYSYACQSCGDEFAPINLSSSGNINSGMGIDHRTKTGGSGGRRPQNGHK